MVRTAAALGVLLVTTCTAPPARACCVVDGVHGIPVRTCEAGICRSHTLGARGECRNNQCTESGKECSAVCPAGYSTSGGTRFTCEEGDRWSSGTLNCTLDECSAAEMHLPDNAEWAEGTASKCRNGESENGFFKQGTICIASCNKGYYSLPDGPRKRVCTKTAGTDGRLGDISWSGGGEPLVCTKMSSCTSALQGRQHRDWEPGCRMGCGSTCSSTCSAPYRNGGENAQEYKCVCGK